MMTHDPVHILELFAADAPVDEDMLAWIRVSSRRFIRGEGSLEFCFRLNNAQRVATRNRELRGAAALLLAGRDLSMWNLAGLLAERIRRFKTTKLILYRRGLPVQLDDIDMHLLAANQSGARSLGHQRRLYDLLCL